MKVIVAKSAGFCFGVRRAVDKVYEQIGKTGKPIYTYGPIIHNEEVVNDLKEKGVEVLHSREELEAVRDCVVVIRSHGVGRDIYELLDRDGIEVVDATCPYVRSIRSLRSSAPMGARLLLSAMRSIRRSRGSKAGAMSAQK